MVAAEDPSGVLDRSFYGVDSLDLAPKVLNKLLVRLDDTGRVRLAGRIVEVEAYRGEDDPASHAFKGLTRRNITMFGPPGRLYVYFTYGMHWCANLVCASEGVAQAVLLRALAPVEGLDEMRLLRGGRFSDHDLLSGPARLCQGMGIDRADDGADLVDGGADVCVGHAVGPDQGPTVGGDRYLRLIDDGVAPPRRPGRSSRVGISVAADRLWRWWVPGDPNVSRGKPSVTGPVPGTVSGVGTAGGRASGRSGGRAGERAKGVVR